MWFETSGSRFCGSSERAGFSYVDFRLNEVANSLRQFKNPRIQRVLERHASLTPPFVGLMGTTYGIICAFNKFSTAQNSQTAVFPCILDAIVFTGIAVLILLLFLLVWDWLSNK
jgi:biopolymer transport protein ExbB/TolQ